MKIKKYIAMMFLALTASYTFTACDDDDTLGEAPRLFRPVASLESQSNTIVVTWENIKGATNYDLDLYRVTGTDKTTGESIYEFYTKASCESSPYTFEDLNWDEKYMVKIKCNSANKESEEYKTSEASVNYISKITSSKSIDNATRISWDEGGTTIKVIKVVTDEEGVEPRLVPVSESQYEEGYVDIYDLTPATQYTFYAYSDKEVLNNSTYAGKISGKTSTAANFDELFGEGNWIDLRNHSDEEAESILSDSEFWKQTTENMGIILKGNFDYKMNGASFDKSITFMTGPTLGSNARIVLQSAIGIGKGVTIDKIQFMNVDIYSKSAIEIKDGKTFVEYNTAKGFGGMQIINVNGTGSTVNKLLFQGCRLEGYRGVVRGQADSDNFINVTFDGCTINGIGDQGVVTSNNKKGDWRTVTFNDCTITNIVMLCDFRSSAGELTLDITNCTFCYAPIETTANANTPLFRLSKNAVKMNISKTLFGPSMATVKSEGNDVTTYTAGEKGSIFTDASAAQINVSQSFKTNFEWTSINDKTYPIDGLLELKFDEKALWQAPDKGDYKVVGAIESGIGASKWQ
ncbi:fibronectin type III domain-containing protein [Bacteroides oleiciplenus]|uniref:fibronectin type III domain-containing protein n=1 Tax=Bacteroides oleiciplenus TaxID=626931 RepID=UPI0026DC8E37|nr:hypothetical protein [Bacteroides oleiciplenus]